VPIVISEPTYIHVRPALRSVGYRWWVAPVARRVICPSEIVADSLVGDGFDRRRIEVIPNGVALDAALPRDEARAELGLPPDGFVVGIVARLREEKAHEVLLRAAARIRGAGRDVTVCVVGDGPERAGLERVARDLRLDGGVVWAGERRDAKRLPLAFDVGVICSDWEGLPVAALETLAAGTPLVATAVGALPGIVDGAGAIVPVRDDAALASAIMEFMDDPARIANAGRRGREIVREGFAFDEMVRRFARVYEDVAAERVRAAA
jgi:glycosyltransferase involved in cell wall biosynthesis